MCPIIIITIVKLSKVTSCELQKLLIVDNLIQATFCDKRTVTHVFIKALTIGIV